jgi:hypothetical protein
MGGSTASIYLIEGRRKVHFRGSRVAKAGADASIGQGLYQALGSVYGGCLGELPDVVYLPFANELTVKLLAVPGGR